jgi:hypothetical protein
MDNTRQHHLIFRLMQVGASLKRNRSNLKILETKAFQTNEALALEKKAP